MRYLIITLLLTAIFACERLAVSEDVTIKTKEPAVASVGDVFLYESDIKSILRKDMSYQDSVVMVKSYINSWAKQQLLLQKAEENISKVNSNEIDDLVKKYRESLYINGLKERLIKQQLDTIITAEEISEYYKQNKDNFKLNEELLQIKYVYFGKDFLDKKETIMRFKSEDEKDLEDLENQTINFKDYHLRDSTWITYQQFLKKIPPFREESKEKLLKISKFIQTEDSLGVYLVAVKDVLNRNDIAPLSYIIGSIKQLILHKRKLELIREIEKTLVNDAIKNNKFKEY